MADAFFRSIVEALGGYMCTQRTSLLQQQQQQQQQQQNIMNNSTHNNTPTQQHQQQQQPCSFLLEISHTLEAVPSLLSVQNFACSAVEVAS